MALGVIVFLGERVYDDKFMSYPLPSTYQLYFTPNPSCLSLIRKQIGAATHIILIQAYSFTDPDIAESLVSAKKRGVDVRIILDKSNLKDEHSKRPLMINTQIPIAIDTATGIAHYKVMIIDGRTVITGSYNFVRRENRTATCSEHYAAEPTVPSVVS